MTEHHQQDHTGHWIPIDLWEAMEDKKVSFLEARLVLLVGYLVRTKKQRIGCYASSEYIAKKLNTKAAYVREMIARMADEGFLRQIGWVTIGNLKYRLLDTKWAMVHPRKDEDLEGLVKRIENLLGSMRNGVNIKVELDFSCMLQHTGSCMLQHTHNIPLLTEGVDGGQEVRTSPLKVPNLFNGQMRHVEDDIHAINVKKLRQAAVTAGLKWKGNVTVGARLLRELKDAYQADLDFCAAHYNDRVKLKLPTITSIPQFLQHYKTWIRDRRKQRADFIKKRDTVID